MTTDKPHLVAVAPFEPDQPDDDVLERLPADRRDQSCAICGSAAVEWVHTLATSLTRYCQFGQGHTLPSFWCICGEDEELFRRGDDDQLARRLYDEWYGGASRPAAITADDWYHELAVLPIEVWRRADMGARPLAAT